MIPKMIDHHIQQIHDTLKTECYYPLNVVELKKYTQCVDVTNVAEYLAEILDEQGHISNKQLPKSNIVSPFQYSWWEYDVPQKIRSLAVKIYPHNGPGRRRVGIMVGSGKIGDSFYHRCAFFREHVEDHQISFVGEYLFETDKQGAVIIEDGYATEEYAFLDKKYNANCLALHGPISTLFLALGFIHCKNVTLSRTDDIKTADNQRRMRQGLMPYFRFNRIEISPVKRILEGQGDIHKNGIEKAFHICRGHFRTYSESAKLFNKLTGTFWIPMHTRGSLEHGLVKKFYQVAN